MIRRTPLLLAAAALVVVTVLPAGADPGIRPELAAVRRATTQYHDVDAAVAAGYRPSPHCVPGMGYHYARPPAQHAADLDPVAPNILVYAPRPDGTLRLVAVEYASFDEEAELFGVTFAPPGNPGPPFSTLHAWIWQANPAGMFAPTNPNITC